MSRRVLSETDIEAALGELASSRDGDQPVWSREGDELVKTTTLADFAGALDFVNRVGAVAEALDHHPDISIRWNQVTLRVTTHSAGALTEADVELARAIDNLE